jgi:restriction system protein
VNDRANHATAISDIKTPPRIDVTFLSKFSGFEEFRRKPDQDDERNIDATTTAAIPASVTPQEALDAAYQQLRRGLEGELLAAVKPASFTFFEQLVVELLVKMKYGGSPKDAGQAIGRTGDDGIDGTIKEDYLGLDNIYVQAKRWSDKTVG